MSTLPASIQTCSGLPRLMKEGESPKAYAAFKAYCEMGDARSLPEMVKKWDGSKNSLYSWAKKFRWDERIDTANSEALIIFRQAIERQAELYAVELARQRMKVAEGNYQLALAAQAKAMEILKAMPVRDVQTTQDGKVIIIRASPHIRLIDAVRLILGANTAMAQADDALESVKRSLEKNQPVKAPEPKADEIMPVLEFWLDAEDGERLPLTQMPRGN